MSGAKPSPIIGPMSRAGTSSPQIVCQVPGDYPDEFIDEQEMRRRLAHRSYLDRTFSKLTPGSMRSGILTLTSSSIGAGILTLPFVLKESGIILGFSMIVGAALLCLFCMALLVWCSDYTGIRSYTKLASYGYGRFMRSAVELTIALEVFGACIGYFAVISKFIPLFFKNFEWSSTGFFQNQFIIVGILLFLVVFPLSLQRDLSALRYAGLFIVLAMFYVTLAMCVTASHYIPLAHLDTDITYATIGWVTAQVG